MPRRFFLRLEARLEPHTAAARKGASSSNHPLDDRVLSISKLMDRRRSSLIVIAARQQPQEVANRFVPAAA
jgi:hypothetical protein